MSKVNCDVCGTAYPETESQCPICGTAKSGSSSLSTDAEAAGYAYVRGGRFSHSNVRKRNNGKKELPRTVVPAKPQKEKTEKPEKPEEQKIPEKQQRAPRKEPEKRQSNAPLVIIAIILALAIVAVCAYIVIKFINDNGLLNDPSESTGSQSSEPTGTGTTDPTLPQQIPCIGLRLNLAEWTFTQVGETLQIEAFPEPENHTDQLTYESSDPLVVTVDNSGLVTAVANGTATITVKCGEVSSTCLITCNVGVEPEDPDQPDDPNNPDDPDQPIVPDEPAVKLELNRKEFSLFFYGDSWNVYSGELDPAEITWTSGNEQIVTVDKGKVVAVGNGDTLIYAEYQGQKVSCMVHCNGIEQPVETLYELRTNYGNAAKDVMIKVGESVTLQLIDKETGLRVSAEDLIFTVQKDGYVTVDEKGRVTGVETNYSGVYVYVEYEGVTYKCLVRVKSAE